MEDLNIPVQAVIDDLTRQIGKLSYELAVANAGLTQARAVIAAQNKDEK